MEALLGTGCVWKKTPQLLVEQRLQRCQSHRHPFCRRAKLAVFGACLANDTVLLPEKIRLREGEPFLHSCHAGALEFIVPKLRNRRLIGAFIFGPFAPPGGMLSAPELPEWRPELAQALPELVALTDSLPALRHYDRLVAPDNLDPRIAAAVEFMTANLGGRLTAAAAARRAALSVSRFSHLFREQMGRDFASCRLELRIGFARELLNETDLDISEVAAASGFVNLSHFSAAFHRLVGCSPRECRRRRSGITV